MIRKFLGLILFAFCIMPFQNHAMVQSDKLTQFLSGIFDVDKDREVILKEQHDALILLKKHDNDTWFGKRPDQTTQKEVREWYKKIVLTNHGDKFTDESDKKAADERFKEICEACEQFTKNPKLDLYNSRISALKIYGQCLVGLSAIIATAFIYHVWSGYKISTPMTLVKDLKKLSNKSIDLLEQCTLDRFAPVDTLLLSAQIDISKLVEQLPDDLGHELKEIVTHVDETIQASFTKVAWSYYDCASLKELRNRDPELVETLESDRKRIHEVLGRCHAQLSKKNRALAVKILKGCGVITALTAFGSGFGYWWLKHGSKISFFNAQPEESSMALVVTTPRK